MRSLSPGQPQDLWGAPPHPPARHPGMAQKGFSGSCCPVPSICGKAEVSCGCQASGEEPRCKASLVAPRRLFLPAKPPSPAGSVLFCSACLLRKTVPAQPQNGLLSSSHPPPLDLPAREAGQPTPAGSCLTALSCGLPGCRSLPPARCCPRPACTADSPGTCLHPLWPPQAGAGGCLLLLQP